MNILKIADFIINKFQVIKIKTSDIEENKSKIAKLFFIISDKIGFPTISWFFLTINKFPIVKIIEFFSLLLQLPLYYQLKKFLKNLYQD